MTGIVAMQRRQVSPHDRRQPLFRRRLFGQLAQRSVDRSIASAKASITSASRESKWA